MPTIKTPKDLGAVIRNRRKELAWDQAKLAAEVGVSRQWVIDIEKGKPRAELDLALRALHALGLSLHAESHAQKTPAANTSSETSSGISINDVLNRYGSNQGLTLDSYRPKTANHLTINDTSSLYRLAQFANPSPSTTGNDLIHQISATGPIDRLSQLVNPLPTSSTHDLLSAINAANSINHLAQLATPLPANTTIDLFNQTSSLNRLAPLYPPSFGGIGAATPTLSINEPTALSQLAQKRPTKPKRASKARKDKPLKDNEES